MYGVYDFENEEYAKSKWIFPQMIDGVLPGFMLIKCYCDGFLKTDGLTHEIYFVLVKKEHRHKEILKNMIKQLPKEWNVWLEANSPEIENIENVWIKCGFSFYREINGRILYRKHL